MSRMIQIRNVLDSVHRKIKARALPAPLAWLARSARSFRLPIAPFKFLHEVDERVYAFFGERVID
jgi:hypothetical protein